LIRTGLTCIPDAGLEPTLACPQTSPPPCEAGLLHLVLESPVWSGFLDPRRGNHEPDWSIHFSNSGQPATNRSTSVRLPTKDWLQLVFWPVFKLVGQGDLTCSPRQVSLSISSCDNPYKMHRRSEMLCLCVHHRGSPQVRVT
jgi:hypothetical protein